MGVNLMSTRRRHEVIETAIETVTEQLSAPGGPGSWPACPGRAAQDRAARRAPVDLAQVLPHQRRRPASGVKAWAVSDLQRRSAPSERRGARVATATADAPGSIASWLAHARAIAEEVQRRVPTADLDERDPDYIRETLPGLWMLASFYFRADVRGLQNIPPRGRCCWSATTRAAT